MDEPSEPHDFIESEELVLETKMSILCRLCANPSDKSIHIFGEEGITNDLATKINQFLPIKVSIDDTLTLQCCLNCYSTIESYNVLYLTCGEVDKRLRELQVEELKGFNDEEAINIQCDTVTEDEQDEGDFIQPTTSQQSTNDDESSNNKIVVEDLSLNCLANPSTTTGSFIKQEENVSEWIVKNEDNEVYHFICQHCNEHFDTEATILEHMKQKHSNSTSKKQRAQKSKNTKIDQDAIKHAKVTVGGKVYYNCKTCGKNLHSPYTYVWHMRIHTGERPFVCDLCGKQFRVSQGLVRHLKETHEGIKNFPCDLCGRMFATRRNVEEHRRIHTNERPYICDLCGKSFKQKASLFVHNRSHTNSFPHRCAYCNQGFRTKTPLLIHMTRHTGEKPYPCEVCGRCFRIKYELKRHMLIHSDEKPFVCSECGISFRQKRYLRNHARLNHNNTENI